MTNSHYIILQLDGFNSTQKRKRKEKTDEMDSDVELYVT